MESYVSDKQKWQTIVKEIIFGILFAGLHLAPITPSDKNLIGIMKLTHLTYPF
jgi:hypothetical protein